MVFLRFRDSKKLPRSVIGKAAHGLHYPIRIGAVLIMLCVPVPVWVKGVVPAILMLPIVFFVIGVACKRFRGGLPHNEAPLVIGIGITAYHPPAVVTGILNLRYPVARIICVVG